MAAIDRSIEALRAFPAALRSFVSDLPREVIDWRPRSWDGIPSERLTIRQQICHLRDIEADGYLVRFKRLLTETNPNLASIDTYALAESRRYDEEAIDKAFASFALARSETLRLLSVLMPGDLMRRGQFEDYGGVTLAGMIHFLCSHDQQHLAGIQWLLGQRAASA